MSTSRRGPSRPCPNAWCSSLSIVVHRHGRGDHPATAGRMTMGLSLTGAMVSSVMYRARWMAHSSFCSIRMEPTSRMIASSFGKMPTTLVLRLISPLGRSMGLVELILSQCSLGKLMKVLAGGVGRALREGGGDEGRDDAAAVLVGVRGRRPGPRRAGLRAWAARR